MTTSHPGGPREDPGPERPRPRGRDRLRFRQPFSTGAPTSEPYSVHDPS